MRLAWAVFMTFFVMGALLWGIFWAVAWLLGITGSGLVYGVFLFVGFIKKTENSLVWLTQHPVF